MPEMKQRLPSLLAVRYFEAVGRNLSFTLAATELNVTQAAVSHQVRLLERELGVTLFTRLHQRIELTSQGSDLLEVATECFDKLSDVTNSLTGRKRASRIHLSISPLLSAEMLIPRIGEFLDANENTEIILHHSLTPPKERDTAYDIKLFFSRTPLSEQSYDFLFKDELVPMCATSLWRGNEDSTPQSFLERSTLIHEFDYRWWEEWCDKAGVDRHVVQRGIALDDPAVLANAAVLGRGVVLGSRHFLAGKLLSGELVAPFGVSAEIEIYYYLFNNTGKQRGVIGKLISWIEDICAEVR